MPQQRDIHEVVKRMLAVIEDAEVKRLLTRYDGDLYYVAPELQWRQMQARLNVIIPALADNIPWATKAWRIWGGLE